VGEERLGCDRAQRDANRPRAPDRVPLGGAGGEQRVGSSFDVSQRAALSSAETCHMM
jgi:hypothetical protein